MWARLSRIAGTTHDVWRTSQLYTFCLWLLTGLVLTAGNGLWLRATVAQTGPDLSKFDPDIYPAIDVGHAAPVLIRADESVQLEFMLACAFTLPSGDSCLPNATLFVARGHSNTFTSVALTEQNRDSLRVLTADLPATDVNGQGLRYYLEVREEQTGAQVRYPTVGIIEPLILPAFTPVYATAGTKLSPELVLHLPWGAGQTGVGIDQGPNQMTTSVDSFDVAPDGTLALLDHVNERVIVIGKDKQFRSFPVPVKGVGDITIDAQGRVTVLDLVGERAADSKVRIPQLYHFKPNGTLESKAPVFAMRPHRLSDDLAVPDMVNQRNVWPLHSNGQARSRNEQRQSRSRTQLLIQYLTDRQARFADTQRGLAFEVQSEQSLGAIPYFGRTQQGYVAVFEAHDYRIVWFDTQGRVLQDVIVPNHQYSVFNPHGRVGVDHTGGVYILGSTADGLNVHRVQGPSEVQQ